MARLDVKRRKIQAKLVYYGPGLCGKTANLQYINGKVAKDQELMSLATEGDMTIFFDFMPLDLGKIRGMDVQFKLYTVPGQVRYNQTRKMVLKNVDCIVFVADSQPLMGDSNLESFDNLFENLEQLGISAEEVPIVLQYNKQDLPGVLGMSAMDAQLNKNGYPAMLASALTGEGVVETLKLATKKVLARLADELEGGAASPKAPDPKPAARASLPSKVATKKNVKVGLATPVEGRVSSPIAAAPNAPAWFEQWANERMKQETLMKADLSLAVAGLKRTEASLAKALSELALLRDKKVMPGTTPAGGLSTLATKSDLESLRKAVQDFGVKAASSDGKGSGKSVASPDAAKDLATKANMRVQIARLKDELTSNLQTKLDALPSKKDLQGLGGGGVGADLGKLEKKLDALVKAGGGAGADLGKLEKKLDALVTAGGGGGADLGKLEKKLDALVKAGGGAGADLGKLEKKLDALVKAGGGGGADLGKLEKKLDALVKAGGGGGADLGKLEKKLDALVKAGGGADLAALQKKLAALPTQKDLQGVLTAVKGLEERIASIAVAAPASPRTESGKREAAPKAEAAAGDPETKASGAAPKEAEAKAVEVANASEDGPKKDVAADEAKAPAGEARAGDAKGASKDALKGVGPKADAKAADPKADAEAAADEAKAGDAKDASKADAKADGPKASARDDAGDGAPKADAAEEATKEATKNGPKDAAGEAKADAAKADAAKADAREADARKADARKADAKDGPKDGAGEVKADNGAAAEAAPVEAPDDKRHKNAARVARVMIADLYLYQQDDVEAGLREGDFDERNKDALSDIQVTYEGRVPEEVRSEFDHVTAELTKAKDKWRKRLNIE